MLPSSSTRIGLFFEYPQGSTTDDVTSYWLAASGHKARMTPKCKTALLATFEAVLERAVIPVSVGNSLNGDLKEMDFSVGAITPNTRNICVDLGNWNLALVRAKFKDELIRGGPKQQWDLFIENVWKLWHCHGITVSFMGNNFVFYGYQLTQLDESHDWQDISQAVDINFGLNLETTPADTTYDSSEHDYAPWGSYRGPDYSELNISQPTQWLMNVIESYGGSVNTGTPSMPTSMAEYMANIRPRQPLGELEDGHLGNWTDGEYSTSVRRSSTAWAVFQTMLANMKYTHISFSYTIDFMHLSVTRTYTRKWVYDDYNMQFSLEDVEQGDPDFVPDEPDYYAYTNYIESRCDKGSIGSSMSIGLKFVFMKNAQSTQDIILNAYPVASQGLIQFDARDYSPEFTGQEGGLLHMTETKAGPSYIDNIDYSLTDKYPANNFTNYVSSTGKIHFVEYKTNLNTEQEWIRVKQETGTTANSNSLYSTLRNHSDAFMSEIPAPSNFQDPASADTRAIATANNTFWSSWHFKYPEQPNYAGNKFFPTHIVTPSGLEHEITEETDRYVCNSGDFFGTFDLAFPDFENIFPYFSWQAYTYGQAMMSHSWLFKALT